MTDIDAAPTAAAPAPVRALSWPPPGLEQLQGDIWPIIGNLGLGGAIMVSPLIWASVTDQPFWNVGASGSAAAALAAILIDFVLVGEAYTSLSDVLRRALVASRAGYGWRIIALVVADRARDTGDVLTASGEYSVLERGARIALLSVRLRAVAFYLSGVLWLLLSFPVVFVLARLGVVSQGALWIAPLVPTATLLLGGLLMRMRERQLLRAVTRSAARPVEAAEAAAWQDTATSIAGVRTGATRAVLFRRLRWVILAGALALIAPLVFAINAALTGPLIELPALSNFATVQQRMGMVQALRAYKLPVDSTIAPLSAGRALHSVLAATEQQIDPTLLPPVRKYSPLPATDSTWTLSLRGGSIGERVVLDLSDSARRAMAAAITHPALDEIPLLARAPRSDLLGASVRLPLADEITMATLPIPRFMTMRYVCRLQYAKAALLAEQGALGEAELALREALSAGYLLLDSGVTLMEALIGTVCIRDTMKELDALYALSGQQAKLAGLRATVAGAQRAAAVAQAGRAAMSQQDILEATPQMVLSDEVPPSMRWDLFSTFNTFAPCLNMHNALFGLGRDYEEWLEQARVKLVRSPAEDQLFDVARHGVFGTRERAVSICGVLGALRMRRWEN